jgi:hypothetical protein
MTKAPSEKITLRTKYIRAGPRSALQPWVLLIGRMPSLGCNPLVD